MALKADQTSGSGLVGKGDKYTTITATGTIVKNGAGRIARILVVSGTGTIDVYDGTSTGGTHLYNVTATGGGNYELDCPCTNGIFVNVGASTTVTVIYT